MLAIDALLHHGVISGYGEARRRLRHSHKQFDLLEGREVIHQGKRYSIATIVTTRRSEPVVLIEKTNKELSK